MKKWALLIGINDYPYLSATAKLHGCVNDVMSMQSILQERFQFPAENMTMLINEQATRANILAALDQLTDSIGDNDIVVVHYSGHGSQMTDREGDEPDGLDETLVPCDSGRGTYENRDITDDEMRAWLLRISSLSPYVTIIFDCCHSGSLVRDTFGAVSRWVEPDDRPISQLPASSSQLGSTSRDPLHGVRDGGWLPMNNRYVLLAACQDDESAYEHQVSQNGTHLSYGTLTYFLVQALSQIQGSTTYRDIFEKVLPLVVGQCARQHPQLEGVRDRELFGIQEFPPIQFVQVRARRLNTVTLGVGAAHGVSVGSIWGIYPPATKVVEEAKRLGTCTISKVQAVTAEAILSDEINDQPVIPYCRAVEEAHNYGEMRLIIEISHTLRSDGADLIAGIEESHLLRIAKPDEVADVRAYLLEPRASSAIDVPVPQLTVVQDRMWAIVGQDGRMVLPPHLASEFNVSATLVENLEKLARYRQTIALLHTDSQLTGKIGFRLLCQDDGHWIETVADEKIGLPVYCDGDAIAARVTNFSNVPIYISILDFGLMGGVDLLHPIPGANEILAPGRTVDIGTRQGDEISLYFPEGFPFSSHPTPTNHKGESRVSHQKRA